MNFNKPKLRNHAYSNHVQRKNTEIFDNYPFPDIGTSGAVVFYISR